MRAILLLSVLYAIINDMGKLTPQQNRYPFASDKVTAPVTVAVIADLHNTAYGRNQARLLTRVREASPDIVVIVGDAFHAQSDEKHTLTALSSLAAEYPCYFVTGNHERHSGECAEIKKTVRALGVTVLEGDCARVTVNGQALQLCGLDDFGHRGLALMRSQLARVSTELREDRLSILLAHRPERFDEYLPHGFDIILAGHAHGGQWRFPGAWGGLIAPGQGWFPKYAGGAYAFGEQTMFVSRGLSNKPRWLARFGNPPEIMLVTVAPR